MKYLLATIAIIQCLHGKSQGYWEAKNYETVTVNNFRGYTAFKYPIDTGKIDYALLNACLFYVVNEQRVKNSLPVIPRHIALETAAFFHSKEMAQRSFYDHLNNKDLSRETDDKRGKLAGMKNPTIAECIYEQPYEDDLTYLALCEGFIAGWMTSKGHHDIIVSRDNISFGAGVFFKANSYFCFRGTLDFQWFEAIQYDPKSAIDKLPY